MSAVSVPEMRGIRILASIAICRDFVESSCARSSRVQIRLRIIQPTTLQHIDPIHPKVFEEVFRDKRSQMESRLRGEHPERAKYGVIDEKLQRVERQLKVGNQD